MNYRDKKKMKIFDISEINLDSMAREFENDERIAYITKNEKLIGIITEGDFFNYKLEKKDNLINTHFLSIEEGENITDVLKQYGAIGGLPVLTKEGAIVGEYYHEADSHKEAYVLATDILPRLNSFGVKSILVEDVYESNRYGGGALDKIDHEASMRGNLFEEDDNVQELFLESQELARDLKDSTAIYFKDGFEQYIDCRSKYVNRLGGERFTYDNPANYQNTIYFFGPCLVNGHFVKDEDTICSMLRSRVGKEYYIKNCGNTRRALLSVIRKQFYKKGDIVVIFLENSHPLKKAGFKVHCIIKAWYNTPNLLMNIWDNLCHVNRNVNKYIADEIWEIFRAENIIDIQYNKRDRKDKWFSLEEGNKEPEYGEITEWLDSVEKYKMKDMMTEQTRGAIVMNCNPFTYGHRYLIEEASKCVSVLYVFVVEEDKSYFTFEDRIMMVREGIKDLKSVIVVPSGKFIISTCTLPGYFEKENKPYVELDATEDLEIFAKNIAPYFGITVRFAGEEPSDPYTSIIHFK